MEFIAKRINPGYAAVLMAAFAFFGAVPDAGLWASDDRPFELRVHRQDFKYIPREFTRENALGRATGSSFQKPRANQVAAYPMELSWWASDSFRFEGAFYSVRMARASYRRSRSGIFFFDQQLPDIKRENLDLSAAYYFGGRQADTRFGVAGGLRGLHATGESGSLFLFHTRDRIRAYGPQLGLRFKQAILSRLDFFANLDLYYMRGDRDFSSGSIASPTVIFLAQGADGTTAEYKGYDAELGLTWRLTEGLSLELGYRREHARFRFKNYFVNRLPFGGQVFEQLENEFLRDGYTKEVLRGAFFGMRVSF